jgi:hypothetical protein
LNEKYTMNKDQFKEFSEELPESWYIGSDKDLVTISVNGNYQGKRSLEDFFFDLITSDCNLEVSTPKEIREEFPCFLFHKNEKGRFLLLLLNAGEITDKSNDYDDTIRDEIHTQLSRGGIRC